LLLPDLAFSQFPKLFLQASDGLIESRQTALVHGMPGEFNRVPCPFLPQERYGSLQIFLIHAIRSLSSTAALPIGYHRIV